MGRNYTIGYDTPCLDHYLEFLDKDGKQIKEVEYGEPLFLGIIESEGLLGRNVLNNHLCVLNGPELMFEI